MTRVLVAEDDSRLSEVLVRGLCNEGYDVDVAARGDQALEMLLAHPYSAAVVDWRMPGMDGVEVVVAAREHARSMPILMLTARDTTTDRIHGLDAGCDDYLVKPFDFQELLARLRALMRRPQRTLGALLRIAGLSIDPVERSAAVNGEPIRLTPTEFAIVEVLARRSPAVVDRDAIANHAWPDVLDPIASNNIDVHVARLRAKLATAGVRFEAVRKVGYRLVAR